MSKTYYSTILKTFQSDLDGIWNKIGVGKRSFAELGEQISSSFKKSEGAANKFKNVLKTIVSPSVKEDEWKRTSEGEIVTKGNIDEYIPKLSTASARKELESLKILQKKINDTKGSWDDYHKKFIDGREYLLKYVKSHNVLESSVDNIKDANKQAREEVIKFNQDLKNQSFSAKASEFAVNALVTGVNMLANVLISKGIEMIVRGIDKFTHEAEYCKERVDNLISSYQSALNEANDNAATIEKIASRYEELSRGVGILGENVSLTTEEYSEYKDIVNQIADIFPNLVKGHTDENTAILTLKGSAQELRDAYKEVQKEAYEALIIGGENSDGKDILKNFKNATKTNYYLSNIPQGLLGIFQTKEISPKVFIESIKKLQKKMFSFNESDSWGKEYYDTLVRFQNDFSLNTNQWLNLSWTLSDIGFNKSKLTDEDKRSIKNRAELYIKKYQAEIDSALKGVKLLANAYMMTDEDYSSLDKECKSAVSIIINNINEEIANGFENNIDVGEYVSNIVDIVKDNPEVQDAFVGLFSLNIEELPISQAKKLIDTYIGTIAEKLEQTPLELKVMLGFESADESIKKLHDHLLVISGVDQWEKTYGNLPNEEIYETYDKLKEYTENFTAEQIDQFLIVTRGIQGLENIISAWENRNLINPEYGLLSEDDLKVIDEYKNKLQELYAALNLLRTEEMSSNDIDELIAKFPELAMYVDNLGEGIEYLIEKELGGLGKAFDGATGEEFLRKIAEASVKLNAIANSFKTTTSSLNEMTSAYKNVSEAMKQYNETGHISLELLETLMETKPEYLGALMDEWNNLENATDAYKAYTKVRAKDYLISARNELVLNQRQIYAEFKKNTEGLSEPKEDDNSKEAELYRKLEKEYREKLKVFEDGFATKNKFYNMIINDEWDGIFDSSSTSDFEQNIDWASHSINVLQNKVSDLRDELSDTSGYDKQIEKIDDLIRAQGDLKQGYENQVKTYQGKYEDVLNNGVLAEHGLKEAAREKIEKGTEFSVELFIAENVESGSKSLEEEIYEELQEAIDWYNKKTDAEKNVLKVKVEIDESEMLKSDVYRKDWENQIDRIEDNKKFINDTIDFDGGKGKRRDDFYNALILAESKIRGIVWNRLKYEKDLLETLDPETDKYIEQEKIIQECSDRLFECDKYIKERQLDIVRLELEAIDEVIESINDKIKDNQDEIGEKDKLISGAVGILNQEVKVQEGLRDVIQDRIDALQEENDEHERALALEKAKYELQRAYSQRTVKLYSGEERGFIYTQDRDAVRDAQENLDKLEYEETIHALQEQVGYYDDIINNLNTIKDSWSNISSAAQEFLEIENLIARYGVGIKDSILSGSYDTDALTQSYKGLLHLGDEFDNDLKKQENLRSDVEEIIERFQSGTITLRQCLDDMGTLLGKTYSINEKTIRQSVEEIVKSTETVPTEVNKANTAVKELEKNTKESTDNINNELSDVPENADKNSSEAAERITKNLESELENQRIVLEHFYEYVDNIFLNMSLSAIDYFQQITDGVKDMIASAKEEIDGLIPDTANSSDQNNDGQNNSDQSKTFGSKPHISFENYPVNHSSDEHSLALMEDEASDSIANSPEDDHITVLGHKDSKQFLTLMQNNEWEKIVGGIPKLGPILLSTYSSNHIPNVTNGMDTTPVVQNITLTLPNVTNENGYGSLVNVLKSLPLDSVQYTHKK